MRSCECVPPALAGRLRAKEVLAYHARDPESLCEKSEGNRIWKALHTGDGPAVLELSLEKEGVWARVHAEKKLGRASFAFLHDAALRMLGLNNETAPFESRHAEFTAPGGACACPTSPPVSTDWPGASSASRST